MDELHAPCSLLRVLRPASWVLGLCINGQQDETGRRGDRTRRKKLNERIIRAEAGAKKCQHSRQSPAELFSSQRISNLSAHTSEDGCECYQSIVVPRPNTLCFFMFQFPPSVQSDLIALNLMSSNFRSSLAGILVYKEIPSQKDHRSTLNFLLFNSQADNIKTDFIW